MGNIEYFNTDAHVYKLNSWITKSLLEVPVFVHFNILGKLERGIHGGALPIPFEDEPNIMKCTNTRT